MLQEQSSLIFLKGYWGLTPPRSLTTANLDKIAAESGRICVTDVTDIVLTVNRFDAIYVANAGNVSLSNVDFDSLGLG